MAPHSSWYSGLSGWWLEYRTRKLLVFAVDGSDGSGLGPFIFTDHLSSKKNNKLQLKLPIINYTIQGEGISYINLAADFTTTIHS